jgi:hypothetical protein
MASILNLVVVAGTAILSVRLFASSLYLRYRAFFYYLIFATVREGVLSQLDSGKALYQQIWVLTEPIEWLFMALVVLELYSLVLQDYKGLATVGRWALMLAIGVALAASCISLIAPSIHTTQGRLMTYYYLAERAVYFSLIVFLVTILGVLMQYPITLSRNVIVHSMLFTVFFLCNVAVFTVLSTRGFAKELLDAVGIVMNVIEIVALGSWLVLLTPAGELRKLRLRPSWMPGKEEQLVSQLNNINAALLRATRKID